MSLAGVLSSTSSCIFHDQYSRQTATESLVHVVCYQVCQSSKSISMLWFLAILDVHKNSIVSFTFQPDVEILLLSSLASTGSRNEIRLSHSIYTGSCIDYLQKAMADLVVSNRDDKVSLQWKITCSCVKPTTFIYIINYYHIFSFFQGHFFLYCLGLLLSNRPGFPEVGVPLNFCKFQR